MEIKPSSGPAAMPEPEDTPAVAPSAGHMTAKLQGPPTQDHFEVYQPPQVDLGLRGMTRLPDPSDAGPLPRDLGSELPANIDIGPTMAGHLPPHGPPEPPPPPPEDLISRFRIPREGFSAFSPEIGGTEQGPSGNPERPDIRHGLGPGHVKSPVPGPSGPIGPDGFDVLVLPPPPDPRTSASVGPPPPGPIKPDPPPDPPDGLSFSRLVASMNRESIAGYQDGDDLRVATGLVSGDLGAVSMGETARGVQDPGPPRNPPDPPPK